VDSLGKSQHAYDDGGVLKHAYSMAKNGICNYRQQGPEPESLLAITINKQNKVSSYRDPWMAL